MKRDHDSYMRCMYTLGTGARDRGRLFVYFGSFPWLFVPEGKPWR